MGKVQHDKRKMVGLQTDNTVWFHPLEQVSHPLATSSHTARYDERPRLDELAESGHEIQHTGGGSEQHCSSGWAPRYEKLGV